MSALHASCNPVRFLQVFLLITPAGALAQSSVGNCVPPAALAQELASHPTAAAFNALAGYFGERNDFSCAISAFRSSLKLEPNSPQTHYYLAIALLAQGNAQEAITELRHSLKLQPNQPQAHLNLGAALSQLNQTDGAIRELQTALETDPNSITAIDWLSKAYMSQKRYPAAIALLKDAPHDEVLEMNLVMAYSDSGNNDLAIDILKRMVVERPASAVPHSGLATIYTRQRRYEDAATEFEGALRLDPHDDVTRAAYLQNLLLRSKFEVALPIAQEYCSNHPDDFEAVYLLGVVERELGNYSEARKFLLQAAKKNPQHYATRYNLGLVYAKLGEPAEARTELEKAIQLDPTSAEAHFQLVPVLRSLSLQDEAHAQLSIYQSLMAERARKDVVAAKVNEAKEALANGDAPRAAQLYRDAIENDPKSAHLHYSLALALERSGDHEGERRALLSAIELDPAFAAAHNQLGLVLLQAGQTSAGENELRTAISLSPHYSEAQNNLGVLYGQQGKDAQATQLFQGAIDSNPRYAQAYVNLAAILASQSRFGEAESTLKKAIEIEPDNPEARALLSQVERQLRKQNSVSPQ
jgi:tetratricopeptide (TPR) repeat protein